MRFLRWVFRDAFLAEYNAGYRIGTRDMLTAIQRTKTVIGGEAPVAGLSQFLAKRIPKDVTIVGCRFEANGPPRKSRGSKTH